MSTSSIDTPHRAPPSAPRDAVFGARQAEERPAEASGVSRAAGAGMPVLAAVFLISLILPNSFYVGPVRLAPFLLVILVAFVPLVVRWVSGGVGRVQLPDLLVLGSALWSSQALFVWNGLDSVQPAGILILQTFGAYLIGRCAIRGLSDMERVMRLFIIIVAILLPFAAYEAVTGDKPYLRLFSVFGLVYPDVYAGERLGLTRVQGAFEHPILFGIFCSSAFAMVFILYDKFAQRVGTTLLIGACTFLSLSTGALVCFVLQVGQLVWGFMFRNHPRRWIILIFVVISSYVGLDVLSNRSPFELFISYATLNSGTAYNRILIWTYGSAEVLRHPFFGIAHNDWQRPAWLHTSSFDMFWLLLALRYGIPSTVMLGAACLLLLFRASRRTDLNERAAKMRTSLVISLVAIFTAIWSVHIWNASFCWMMFLTGALGWLAEKPPAGSALATAKTAAGADDPAPRGADEGAGPAPRGADEGAGEATDALPGGRRTWL